MADRPNVLFLMDDEHRPDVLGYAGDDVVRTPTLDRLAATGVTFENAYTPAPRCVPARQCLATGRLPRTCGCETYGSGLPPESMTLARRFAQWGYETVAAGKLDHRGQDTAQGWTTLVGRHRGSAVEPLEDAPPVAGSDRPGDAKWSDAKEVRRAGVGAPGVGWKDDTDAYRVEGAIDYVRSTFLDPHYDREAPDSPVLLTVSLSQPHYPYLTTQERFEYYLNRVEPYDDEADRAFDDHPLMGARRLRVGADGFHAGRQGDVSPREVRRATAAYYGMIETVDDYFGRVLDALERAGEDLDEWIVVYTADHGEMLGEHGVWEKGHFFEASAGVPLVIRWPERLDAASVAANVSLCDLFATLCDLAGVPFPADEAADSRSLVPLLGGATGDWTDEAVSAYGDDVMVKRGDLKYVHAAEGEDVLFDLRADPGETENRVGDPAYADDVASFRERVGELGYGPGAAAEPSVGYEPGLSG